ncbi:hypothetical protein PHMEG_00036934 [Phytophthora megakarya]|uniref:SWIM-type domain-containing protein n=1 Tax=Phytophthora megakarya TaxID=4795 RepID=A0A225UKU2_9STRA|nr:hypothetical protein PHMEG_00036934 [Phytophthora megakarya]
MWANHARGRYFSAGNTTTNRIESNWNQLKLLLGKKPRLDVTVQSVVYWQIRLQLLDSYLSQCANTLRKGTRAMGYLYGIHINFTCTKLKERFQWKVVCRGYKYVCDEVMWSCSSLFYQSNHLPCQHLMYIA